MLEVTYYGTATVRLRLPNGIVLVTDPTFDPPGVDYGMTEHGMTRTLAGFPPPDAAGVDAVLLSHRDHPDNFDRSGRAFASQVGCVIGTNDVAGLAEHSVPLEPWESYPLGRGDSQTTITAVPARHGPVELLPYVGEVTGFIIESPGPAGAIYVSGDTVYGPMLAEIGERFDIHTAIIHFGAAKLPMMGDHALSLTAVDGVRLARALAPTHLIPVHYEGWAHFTEGKAEVDAAIRAENSTFDVCWLSLGVPTGLDAAPQTQGAA